MTTIKALTANQHSLTKKIYHRDALTLIADIKFDRRINEGERIHVTYLIKNKLNDLTIIKKVFEYTADHEFFGISMSLGNNWSPRNYSTPGSREWQLPITGPHTGLYGFSAILRMFSPKTRNNEWIRTSEPLISEEVLFEYVHTPVIVFPGN